MSIRFIGSYRPGGRIKIRRYMTPPPPTPPRAPEWVTPTGFIGAFNEGSNIDYALIASDPDANIATYKVVSGALPDGVTVNTISGHILGTIGQVSQDTTFTFTVRVTDKTDLFADRQFNLVVKNVGTMVAWQTPSGSLGSGDSGADYSNQVKANSNG